MTSTILEYVLEKLEQELDLAIKSADASHQAATHSELQAKSKYETQGIEASYLAGAQAKRVSEIKSDMTKLSVFKKEVIHNDKVVCGQVFILESNQKKEAYFVLPILGRGYQFTHGEKVIHIISAQSPIGKEVLGLSVGDFFEVEKGRDVVEYEVKEILAEG